MHKLPGAAPAGGAAAGYSPRQRAILRRLLPAWITEDFLPVADILEGIGASQPESAWSPGREAMPDPRLRSMHDIWRSQAGDEALPRAETLDPALYVGLEGIMMFLDFSDDGLSLSYRHYGAELAVHSGTDWTGRSTADMARFSEYSLLFASSYLASATLREPLYSELVSAPKLVSTTWCRYLMPYVDDEGRVVSFACANLPVPGVPTWAPVRGRTQATKNRLLAGETDQRERAAALLGMERNVRDILASSPAAMMVVAPEAVLVYFLNEPMAALVGLTVDALRTTDPRAIFANGRDFDDALARSLAGGAVRDIETRLARPDGGCPWVLMSAQPIAFDGNDRVAFWFYDISERKAALEALMESKRRQEATIRQLEATQAELRTLADRDSLTGLPNRRFFKGLAAHELEVARRRRSPLGVLMVDIDFFKQVNDDYGHPAGDEVLKAVASALDAGKRASDMLARFGGEEFLLLLPDTDARGALLAGEKLRAAVEASSTPWLGEALRVTISVGASVLADGEASLDEAVARADEALYEAKREGRNRVALKASAP